MPAEDRYEEALPVDGRPTKTFFDSGALQIGEKPSNSAT